MKKILFAFLFSSFLFCQGQTYPPTWSKDSKGNIITIPNSPYSRVIITGSLNAANIYPSFNTFPTVLTTHSLLTVAMINSLTVTPITLIGTPPTGKNIFLVNSYMRINYGSVAWSSFAPVLIETGATTPVINFNNAIVTSTVTRCVIGTFNTPSPNNKQIIDGSPVTLTFNVGSGVPVANSGNSTFDIWISYFLQDN